MVVDSWILLLKISFDIFSTHQVEEEEVDVVLAEVEAAQSSQTDSEVRKWSTESSKQYT